MRLRFAILLALALLEGPVTAQDNVATVRLDGNAVFQVGPSDDEDDAAERARRIETRLAGLLRNLDALAPPIARQTPDGWTVSVSGIPVVTPASRQPMCRCLVPITVS